MYGPRRNEFLGLTLTGWLIIAAIVLAIILVLNMGFWGNG
jgi:hypothetical protein